MARVTGLEPATFGVTGRRSNQLSYTPMALVYASPPGNVKQGVWSAVPQFEFSLLRFL